MLSKKLAFDPSSCGAAGVRQEQLALNAQVVQPPSQSAQSRLSDHPYQCLFQSGRMKGKVGAGAGCGQWPVVSGQSLRSLKT